MDGNHELAGKTLNFAVEISAIRDASAEELSNGHLLGPSEGQTDSNDSHRGLPAPLTSPAFQSNFPLRIGI